MNTVENQNMADATEDEAVRALFFMHSSPVITSHSTLVSQQEAIPNFSLSSPSTPHYSKSMETTQERPTTRSLRSNSSMDLCLSANSHAAAGALCAFKAKNERPRRYSMFIDQKKATSIEQSRARALSLMSLDTEYDTQMLDSGQGNLSSSLPEKSFLDMYRLGVNGTVNGGQRMIGSYNVNTRRRLLDKFLEKRKCRTWKKKIKYDVRKNFADSRLRVKGRFVRKEDEEQLREVLLMTA